MGSARGMSIVRPDGLRDMSDDGVLVGGGVVDLAAGVEAGGAWGCVGGGTGLKAGAGAGAVICVIWREETEGSSRVDWFEEICTLGSTRTAEGGRGAGVSGSTSGAGGATDFTA